MSLKHLRILDEEDEDPMLSAINLVDVFLVLVVALLVALSIRQQNDPAAGESVTIIRNAGQPGMEVTVREQGKEIRFKGTGEQGAAQGVRAGVAYRLPDATPVLVGKAAFAEHYRRNRFNLPALHAEVVSRMVIGNKVIDHERVHGVEQIGRAHV